MVRPGAGALRRLGLLSVREGTERDALDGTGGDADSQPAATDRQRRAVVHRPALVALGVALVVTGALAWAASSSYEDNENRLLTLQVRQAAAALSAALPGLQTPLVADYELAVTGDDTQLRSYAASQVGPKGRFASVSVWQLGASPHPVLVVGDAPELAAHPARAAAFFAGVAPSATLHVAGLLDLARPALGYAEVPPGANAGLAVYAESMLHPATRGATTRGSAFSDLNFALYLGPRPERRQLIEATVPLPITGRQRMEVVPFGDTSITLVATPDQPLGGGLTQNLRWLVVGGGIVLALLAGLTAEFLVRRRRTAERLAAENDRLYRQQRAVAETLQHALLPTELPEVAGVELAARYVAGVRGMEIGGDWYDVIAAGDGTVVLVVGDVSGRGLPAATTMASLRYAVRAYVGQGDEPDRLVAKLDGLLSVGRDGQFATLLCGRLEVASGRLALVSAGHPPPLVAGPDDARYLTVPVGPPVGVGGATRPAAVEVELPAGATLLAFTDGLVERRGEHLDDGLERLRKAADDGAASAGSLLDDVLAQLVPDGGDDDVALLGIRRLR